MKIFECISVLRALGEENRLRLVKLLLTRPMGVNELAEASGQSQYNVSKHLRTLREAGLVEVAKEGQKRLYSVSGELHTHLKRNRNTLDLGCCTFDFDEASKGS
ncbi:MAG: ArsR/SmtB family transcription factor [Verrucomicrobiales bacterium]